VPRIKHHVLAIFLIFAKKNMQRAFGVLFLVFWACCAVRAQGLQHIQIVEDPAISTLLSQYTENNKQKPYIRGWRLQILATTDRPKLDEVLSNFKAQYPFVPVTWLHERPYYLLRVGAYHTKLEAMRLQELVRGAYPGSYMVQDNQISPSDFIGY